VNAPGQNQATRAVPGVASGQTDRNRATRAIPGTGTGGPPGRIQPRPSDRNRTPPRGVVRGYANGLGWDRGWDWDRNRNRAWYVNRDRDWYRYWNRDRLWNWRVGPIPGWWIGFRFAPRGVSFAWHVNLFWNSWDNHYGWRQDHAWLHRELDRIHEDWHLRYGWRGYTEGWYRAHEALHDRLEYEHDLWYRRGAYAWPWHGPEIWVQWGIPDPWQFEQGYYDDGYYDPDYHGSLDWR
jgi:hypothetical protein